MVDTRKINELIRQLQQDMQRAYNEHWVAFVDPLWQWERNEYYIFYLCICNFICPA